MWLKVPQPGCHPEFITLQNRSTTAPAAVERPRQQQVMLNFRQNKGSICLAIFLYVQQNPLFHPVNFFCEFAKKPVARFFRRLCDRAGFGNHILEPVVRVVTEFRIGTFDIIGVAEGCKNEFAHIACDNCGVVGVHHF